MNLLKNVQMSGCKYTEIAFTTQTAERIFMDFTNFILLLNCLVLYSDTHF